MAEKRPPAPPSETVRAVVTVALGLYFVGLALCVVGNSASGGSALVRTIHARLFSPWMTPPWLNVGHDTRLTHGLPEDADHWIEVRGLDDTADPVALPSQTMRGERAARWRRLARAIAVAEADPDREALLPAAVGAGAAASHNAGDVSLRVMRHLPADRSEVVVGRADVSGRHEQAYAARVRIVDGDVQLIATTPRNELAPLVKEPQP